MIGGRESEEGVEQRIRADKRHVECRRDSEKEREGERELKRCHSRK